MTADTETIRRMLAHFENAAPSYSERAGAADALAALGRVEERERALTEALERFIGVWFEGHTKLRLSSAAGSGEE